MKYLLLGIAILYTTLSFSQSQTRVTSLVALNQTHNGSYMIKDLILSNQMMPIEQIIIFNSPMPLKILLQVFSMNLTCQMRF